jgi:hypothetical protein
MENVRQVIVPIVPQAFHEKIFYLYVSFLSPSIKIVFPENINPSWLIPKTGQLGFSQRLVL